MGSYAEYPADNIVELLRLLHCVMQNVHPRQTAEPAQAAEAAAEYDYGNKPCQEGLERGWEPPGAPTLLLHFLGGVMQDPRERSEEADEIDMSTRGLLASISMLAEARSLRAVSKPVSRGEPTQRVRCGGRSGATRRQLYLAPRVRHLVMAAPTQGILMLSRPELLQEHVWPYQCNVNMCMICRTR